MTKLEDDVWQFASELGLLEQKLAQEYLLRVGSGVNTFQAQKMAEVVFAQDLRKAQASYEIALDRMRKS